LRGGFKGSGQGFVSVSATLATMASGNSNRLDLDNAGVSLFSQQAYRCNSFGVLAQQQQLILGDWRSKCTDARLNF
jgi:hypothetical protein